MASRIKGITIDIGGDTTGLDKALMNILLRKHHMSGNMESTNPVIGNHLKSA